MMSDYFGTMKIISDSPFVLLLLLLLFSGMALFGRNRFLKKRKQKTAEKIITDLQKVYMNPLETRELFSLDEFSYLDLEYYRRTEALLKDKGFVKLGDVEVISLSKVYPRLRTFQRLLINKEGIVSAAIYHSKPRGWWGKIKYRGTDTNVRVLELNTEFIDGTFISTSNAPRRAGAIDNGPGIAEKYYPDIKDIDELLEKHQQDLKAYMELHPQARPVLIHSLKESIASGDRAQTIRIEYRKSLPEIISKKEFERMIGQPLNPDMEELYAQMRMLQGLDNSTDTQEADQTRESQPFDETQTSPAGQGDIEQEEYDPEDAFCEKVLSAIEKKRNKRKNPVVNLLILLVTLVVFFHLGFFRYGLQSVLVLIGVIFFHEMGHYVGMRIFGYRNVQMFFIPLVGAAVAGESRDVAGWKKAIVILMGPMPGIILSFIFHGIYLVTREKFWHELGFMFVVINFINLLPITPLDGGRLLQEVLFSRNRYIESVLQLMTGLALLTATLYIKEWFVGLLGVINLITASNSFKVSGIADGVRQDLFGRAPGENEHPQTGGDYAEDIPQEVAKNIIHRIKQKYPVALKLDTVAEITRQVWERVHVRQPAPAATFGFILVYFMGVLMSFISMAIAAFPFFK
ncbi:MAG: site-2 protease family protein [Sedimentisphaerales bacterium]|nr:site-2 protease family protein [Sedimentisphaerales bacterium]